jgi:hypothetical protein
LVLSRTRLTLLAPCSTLNLLIVVSFLAAVAACAGPTQV